VQYLSGSTWSTFSPALTLTGGTAHYTWAPTRTAQYRILYGTTYSDPFTVTVVPPTVTGTADSASITLGAVAGATAAVSPVPTSGTVYMQYLSGSTWSTFSPALTLTGGTAHYTWSPTRTAQYRILYGTYLSDPFTITVNPT
jgi:hypothetical protein